MADPVLRIRASGYGGSGYYNPITGEKVIGVTTALGAASSPGITSWAVDNTAAYAVANVDALLNRTEEQGFGFLRWYTKRFKPDDFDNPDVDIRDASNGVLDDLAELGTLTHEWIEAHLNGDFEPEVTRIEHAEMIEAFLEWEAEHDIEVHATELTLFGATRNGFGYGGTADLFATIDGVPTLCDFKTSRAVREAHISQMAAYGAAEYAVEECDDEGGGVAHKGKYFRAREVPPFSQYAVLQVRPSDTDNEGNPIDPFCKLHIIPQEAIEAGYGFFEGTVALREHSKGMKNALKGTELGW